MTKSNISIDAEKHLMKSKTLPWSKHSTTENKREILTTDQCHQRKSHKGNLKYHHTFHTLFGK